jgi:hypothetical protein
MSDRLTSEFVKANLIPFVRECFDQTSGIFLDKDTALLNSISKLTARQASRSTVEGGSTIAGHVEHIRFYLRVINDYIDHKDIGKVDWRESWLCREVNEGQWQSLRENLAGNYRSLLAKSEAMSDLADENRFGGLVAIIAHTAFHLGAIRQMMLIVAK